ncbi:hypothetical protein L6164_013700 [Bauhinia variegata]|uniref:Uncharacterized protein n=1 Tax=Bauhinia variegata TaxID=167791 RepID=A0ACB9NIL8_BAUVA|nr:hypothetical protein L6164_013700 [Bauhinia variegata]
MCSRWWWWYTAYFRWPEFDFSMPSWSAFDLPHWTISWILDSLRWLNFSLVDDVVWAFVMFLESIALAAMLCYFFLCCGCTL